jgi:methyltransferase (TIGR00027 family)
MNEERPSATAEGAAIMRALHQTPHHDPKILDDPISPRLVNTESDLYKRRVELLNRLPTPTRLRLEATFVMRSRYAEDCVAEAYSNGVRQCVLLGAGLDTFAYRQASWASSLHIFEVDHPQTQRWKLRLLSEAGVSASGNIGFVPLDFNKDSLASALAEAGLDLSASTFFSMLGVTQYLSEDALNETFKIILSRPASSEIVFSFVADDAVLPPDDVTLAKALLTQAAAVGEPWLSRFIPEQLVARLRKMGFSQVLHLTPEEANHLYFQNRRDGLNAALMEQMIRATV